MNCRSLAAILVFAVALTAATSASAADRRELRIATVAPAGSAFHKRLQTLGADWARGPGGGVTINI